MIIGDGDIASILPENDDLVFFASGVSNSAEARASEFEREKELLFKTQYANPNKRLVYFGSLAIFYSDTPYAQHKKRMETYVKMFPKFAIVRIGNIDWGKNPNTIINSMRARHAAGLPLEIQDVYRYVTGEEEFLHWIGMIPNWNCEINVPGKRMKIKEIVEKYVYNTNKTN